MTTIALYLLKVFICSGILFLYYLLALRNKIFHQWNRFYLLSAVVLSLLLPLVQISLSFQTEAQSNAFHLIQSVQSADNYLEEIIVVYRKNLTPEQWVELSYLFICLVIFILFLASLLKIFFIIRSHTVNIFSNIKFINTNVPGTPFSFFDYIFWNENISLQSPTGQQIFQHELVHVKEKHSLDKLFMEIVLVFFWCNPFFWLIRKELHFIHEFIADKKAVAENDTAAFAAMILQAAYPAQFHSITNQFFQTSIKRRLAMLTKIQNKKVNYFSRIIALPLLVLVAFAFTVRTKIEATKNMETLFHQKFNKKQSNLDTIPYKQKEIKSIDVNKSSKTTTITYTDGKVEKLTEQEAIKRNLINNEGRKQNNLTALKDTGVKPIYYVNGKEFNGDLNTIDAKKISSVNVIKGPTAIEKYGEKGKNGVVEIFLKIAESKDDNRPVFEKAETPASIDKQVWRKFAEENFQTIAIEMANQGALGTYTIYIRFIVDTDGSLTDISALNDPGYGIVGKVLELMQKSPKWTPAIQNGHVVRSFHTQPITFAVQDQSGNPDPSNTSKQFYNPEEIKNMTLHQLVGLPESDEIISCIFAIDLDNGDVRVAANDSNTTNDNVKKLLQSVSKGRMLTIENIQIKREGKVWKIPSKVYKM